MSSLKISVIGLNEDESKLFIKESCGMPVPAGSGFKQIGDIELQFTCRSPDDMTAALEDAGRAALIVHHMDLISVQRLRAINEHMLKNSDIPCLWILLRLKDESEFKISCIECGQKIWIPDGSQGGKAHCPKCKQSFTIPSREEYLRLVLGIDDVDRIVVVVEGETDSFGNVVDQLIALGDDDQQPSAPPTGGRKKIVIRKPSSD